MSRTAVRPKPSSSRRAAERAATRRRESLARVCPSAYWADLVRHDPATRVPPPADDPRLAWAACVSCGRLTPRPYADSGGRCECCRAFDSVRRLASLRRRGLAADSLDRPQDEDPRPDFCRALDAAETGRDVVQRRLAPGSVAALRAEIAHWRRSGQVSRFARD